MSGPFMINTPFAQYGKPPVPPPQNVPVGLSPTNAGRGEPVMITGPWQGQVGEQIRVKFYRGPWLYARLLGPYNATVTVPMTAETGPYEVEYNGRTVLSGQFFVRGTNGRNAMGSYISTGASLEAEVMATLNLPSDLKRWSVPDMPAGPYLDEAKALVKRINGYYDQVLALAVKLSRQDAIVLDLKKKMGTQSVLSPQWTAYNKELLAAQAERDRIKAVLDRYLGYYRRDAKAAPSTFEALRSKATAEAEAAAVAKETADKAAQDIVRSCEAAGGSYVGGKCSFEGATSTFGGGTPLPGASVPSAAELESASVETASVSVAVKPTTKLIVGGLVALSAVWLLTGRKS